MTENALFNARHATDRKQTAVIGTPITDLEMLVAKSNEPTFPPYGYKLSTQRDGAGDHFEAMREIDSDQAAIVRRIYQLYADGVSPAKIAEALNAEGIRGPRGLRWRDTTIRGDRARHTGILNNEIYSGRSRVPGRDCDLTPALRIVSDELWTRVKQRQGFAARGPVGTP
ncbi:recombinase family protein [Rhizobium sp. ZX09]|uniref:recombinase family protein n=1 Tax=Rhizobium sp. ZX09 TaxID=2291939 RepID=UPI001A99ADE9|nr:recombinase family protein [Rhizobium sp. ZX09]QSZ59690.1 hypothetical protein BTN45_21355 [Rhizobium sp. ZX09]